MRSYLDSNTRHLKKKKRTKRRGNSQLLWRVRRAGAQRPRLFYSQSPHRLLDPQFIVPAAVHSLITRASRITLTASHRLSHQAQDKRHWGVPAVPSARDSGCCNNSSASCLKIKSAIWFSSYFQVRNFSGSYKRKTQSRFRVCGHAAHSRSSVRWTQFLQHTASSFSSSPGWAGENGGNNRDVAFSSTGISYDVH